MKRLVSRSEREKKAKKNQVIIGVLLVFLMLLSILGFALQGGLGGGQNNENKLEYNGFELTYLNGFWRIGNFAFTYNPEEVPEIGLGLKDATSYQSFPAYVYSENSEAETEIMRNLEIVAQRIQNACIDEPGAECSEGDPTKTCEDNFIIIKENNSSSLRQEGGCVYIEGPSEELLKIADQFLFKILGIK